jgi:DnaK suppressor protein
VVDVRATLERTRDELRAELATLTAALVTRWPRCPSASGWGGTSQAVERIAQVDAAKNLDAKLGDVLRALEKLDEGTYGTCDVCGKRSEASGSKRSRGPFAASGTPRSADAYSSSAVDSSGKPGKISQGRGSPKSSDIQICPL